MALAEATIPEWTMGERCAATVPPPVVEPGVQLVEVEADFDQAH